VESCVKHKRSGIFDLLARVVGPCVSRDRVLLIDILILIFVDDFLSTTVLMKMTIEIGSSYIICNLYNDLF
jgi:hypothetical protein